MCCGQKREALRNSAAAGTKATAVPRNLYYLRNVPDRLRGSVTGRPAQAGDPRDASTVVRNRLLRGD
jgi:hypothetical protein